MRLTSLALALATVLAGTAHAADTTQLVQGELPQVTAWRRDIHQHPELSNRETRTSALVAAQLKKLGLEVHTGIAHTGVVAILKGGKPGPKLAIRADMDALPVTEDVDVPFASKAKGEYRGKPVGVMHACGHDAHTAMLLGLATVLAGMRKDLPGQVMFVFQPAEEGAPPGEQGGASLMLRDGVFRDFKPDAMFGMHVVSSLNVGTVGVRPGPAMAGSDWFKMVVHGKQTHGAMPWNGVDPIVTSSEIIGAAQTIVSRKLNIGDYPAVLSFGIIEGGARYNIVPDQVEMQGTLRTFDAGMRQQAIDNLKDIAQHIAAANGATVETQIPVGDSNPVLVNNPALTARVSDSIGKAIGSDHVIEAKPWMASEDFAYFANEVPSVYFWVGSTPVGQDALKAPANHSPKFFMDEGALKIGMASMLQATLDYLNAPKS
ncbi:MULTISPECIES: amidohydrolase [unclassified Dyella]|jgi:amidohydrolase|uniref:amidohydrolase n=1 Tax=unclassified Dyella TaxID=2634549 RepID=UPI003F8E4E7E